MRAGHNLALTLSVSPVPSRVQGIKLSYHVPEWSVASILFCSPGAVTLDVAKSHYALYWRNAGCVACMAGMFRMGLNKEIDPACERPIIRLVGDVPFQIGNIDWWLNDSCAQNRYGRKGGLDEAEM